MSNAAKHTPGPWKVNEAKHTEVLAHGRSEWNTLVASVPVGMPDARLIAAAPDLLAAALNAVRKLAPIKYDSELDPNLAEDAAIIQLLDAITKATGGQS